MSQNAQASLQKWKRPDLAHVSDEMVYDIARHTASVLSSMLLNLARDARNAEDRAHWEARRRLVKQHSRALNPEDRALVIAQNEAWQVEKLTLPLPDDLRGSHASGDRLNLDEDTRADSRHSTIA